MKRKKSPALFDVGGYRLALSCQGVAKPCVILDCGIGCGIDSWQDVQPAVAQFARVCSYDRPGIGNSDLAPVPRTVNDIVCDLRALLPAISLNPPYVLVGHLFAALTALLFTSRYADQVAGLVLVDPSHPRQEGEWLSLLPSERSDEADSLRNLRRYMTVNLTDPNSNPEKIHKAMSYALMQEVGSLGDLPLIVLTRGRIPPERPGLPAGLEGQMDQVGYELHAEYASRSTNSLHIVAERSGHFIQNDQPAVVIDAIRRVVEAVRTGEWLAR